jgi:ketosteroid isomerase-like protein
MFLAMRVLALALLAACAPPKIPTATDELDALRARWLAAFNGKQLDAVVGTYALDAVFLPITGNRVVSRLAIKNLYTQIWERFTPHIELTSKGVERSAQLAYETGEYREAVMAGESRLDVAGSYVFVYRRDPDGWHIASQIFTETQSTAPVQ